MKKFIIPGIVLIALAGYVAYVKTQKAEIENVNVNAEEVIAAAPDAQEAEATNAVPEEAPEVKTEESIAQKFVTTILGMQMYEAKMAEIAVKNANDQPVKAYAQKIQNENVAASNNFEAAMEKSGLGFYTAKDMTAEQKEKLAKLEPLKGAKFDAAFIQLHKDATDEMLSVFMDYRDLKEMSNRRFREFIKMQMPIIQNQRDDAYNYVPRKVNNVR